MLVLPTILLLLIGFYGAQAGPEVTCISLGACCRAALTFKKKGLSRAYYPFDFIVTPLHGLHTCLDTQFKHFISKKYLHTTGTKQAWLDKNADDTSRPMLKKVPMVVVKNKSTGCEFVHDFKDETLGNYNLVAAKYQRRIDRFYKTINQAKQLYFFRTHLTKSEAKALRTKLKQLFPKANFTLIVPTDPKHMAQPWHLTGVKEFPMYDRTTVSQSHHGTHAHWNKILKALDLIQ